MTTLNNIINDNPIDNLVMANNLLGLHYQELQNLQVLSHLPFYEALNENLSRDNITNFIQNSIRPHFEVNQNFIQPGHQYDYIGIQGCSGFVNNGNMDGPMHHVANEYHDSNVGGYVLYDHTKNYNKITHNNYDVYIPFIWLGVLVAAVCVTWFIVSSILQRNREMEMLEELRQSRQALNNIHELLLDSKKILLDNLPELQKNQIASSSAIEHMNFIDVVSPILNELIIKSPILDFCTNVFAIVIIIMLPQLIIIFFPTVIYWIKISSFKIFSYIKFLYTKIYFYFLYKFI